MIPFFPPPEPPSSGGTPATFPDVIIGGSGNVSSIVRYPFVHVDINGVQIANVLSFRCSHGYDLAVAECTVSVPEVPAGMNFWDVLGIRAGATQGTAATRFNGFVVEVDYTLWPREVQIVARGPLIRAQLVDCATAAGIDLSNAGAGKTDEAIVQQLLDPAGIISGGAVPVNIQGTGRTLGTVAGSYFLWPEGQSALQMIQQLDAICLGYRTFDTPSGGVARVKISSVPSQSSALTFTEGVDIFSASPQVTVLNTKTKVIVTGFDDGSGGGPANYTISQANPLMPLGDVVDQISSNLIESSTTGGAGISAEEVAEWWLGEVNRAMGKYTLVTPRDDVIIPGMTITINAPNRLGISQNFWVQNVSPELDQNGTWSQQIIAIAGLLGIPGSNQNNTIGTPSGGVINTGSPDGGGPDDGGAGSGGSSGGGSQGNTPPTNTPPIVDFTVDIQSEQVLISGVATTLYDIQATAHAQGTSAPIATYSWSFPDGGITTATDDTLVSTVTAIPGTSIITLTVTDTNGNAASAAHPVIAPAIGQVLTRALYLAGGNCMEAFNGGEWKTQTETDLHVVGNGPVWADDAGDVYAATVPFSAVADSIPFGGRVDCLWIETDVSATNVLAGSDNGAVALSTDGGQTWTISPASPSGSHAVRKVAISRSNSRQWFALCDGGLFRTDNAGSGWVQIASAAGSEQFTDFAIGFERIFVAMAGGRQLIAVTGNTSTTQTMPSGWGNTLSVAPHIRKDACYAIDHLGQTAAHVNSGDTTLMQGTDLPGGTPQFRGLWRDGKVVDLLYIAAGAAGVYKSIDGLRTPVGYFTIRTPGVGSSPSGAYYTQIGADGTLRQPPLSSPVSVDSTPGAEKVFTLGVPTYTAEPSGWTLTAFVDTSWQDSVAGSGDSPYTSPPGASWVTYAAGGQGGHHRFLLRKTFTAPGSFDSASLAINGDDTLQGVFMNGTNIIATVDTAGPYATYNIPSSVFIKGGTNVLALIVQNAPGGSAGPDGATFSLVFS